MHKNFLSLIFKIFFKHNFNVDAKLFLFFLFFFVEQQIIDTLKHKCTCNVFYKQILRHS